MEQNNSNILPTFYTVNDIQKLMGIGRNKAYNLVNQNGFPAILVGNRIIIPANLFNEWIINKANNRKRGM